MTIAQKETKINIIIIFLCFFFIGIGILITQNEIYGDEWYITGSADGLFGRDNISLMVLCSNYIITSLIHLLSLTGLRLNWMLIIMLFFEYITFFLVFKSLIARRGIKVGIILSGLFSIIIIPCLYRMHMFTNASAFLVAGGVFWLLDCIKNKKNYIQYILGYVLVIMGFSIRGDVIFFSIFFFGIIWVMDVIYVFLQKDNKKNKIDELKRYALPFAIVFFFMFVIYYSQIILMEKENPGIYKWNTIRSQVDNFPIPEFEKYKIEYEKIGITEVDYKLLKSLNNLDPEFFTQERYEEILKLKDKVNIQTHTITPWRLIIKSIRGFCDNSIAGIWFFILLFAFLYKNKKLFFKSLILVIANFFLIGYFCYINRFIQRIEWSIWINILFAILLLQYDIKTESIEKFNFKEKTLLIILLLLLLFGLMVPIGGSSRWNDLAGKNIYKQYRYSFALPDNYYHYLYNCITKNDNFRYKTHNYPVLKEILEDKTSFYFILYTQAWLMPFPVTGKDIFRTAEIGTASNWGVLGEYTLGLKPIQRNINTYNIVNPFRELINDNIKVVVRKSELYSRTHEIYSYIKKHYYSDVCFSIYKKYNDTVVGKYKKPFDTEKMYTTEKDVGLLYGDSTINQFFSIKILGDYDNYKEKYLQLEDSRGKKYVFTFEKDKNIVTFYKELLDLKEKYSIKIVLLDDENKYSVIRANNKYNFKEALKLKNI